MEENFNDLTVDEQLSVIRSNRNVIMRNIDWYINVMYRHLLNEMCCYPFPDNVTMEKNRYGIYFIRPYYNDSCSAESLPTEPDTVYWLLNRQIEEMKKNNLYVLPHLKDAVRNYDNKSSLRKFISDFFHNITHELNRWLTDVKKDDEVLRKYMTGELTSEFTDAGALLHDMLVDGKFIREEKTVCDPPKTCRDCSTFKEYLKSKL